MSKYKAIKVQTGEDVAILPCHKLTQEQMQNMESVDGWYIVNDVDDTTYTDNQTGYEEVVSGT